VAVRCKEGSVAETDRLSWSCLTHWMCPPGSGIAWDTSHFMVSEAREAVRTARKDKGC